MRALIDDFWILDRPAPVGLRPASKSANLSFAARDQDPPKVRRRQRLGSGHGGEEPRLPLCVISMLYMFLLSDEL